VSLVKILNFAAKKNFRNFAAADSGTEKRWVEDLSGKMEWWVLAPVFSKMDFMMWKNGILLTLKNKRKTTDRFRTFQLIETAVDNFSALVVKLSSSQ
jgi:hypothetical protein